MLKSDNLINRQSTKIYQPKNVLSWVAIVRSQWIKQKPSRTIFRSKDIFSWVADGSVELLPADLKPINAPGREIWRHRLSRALKTMADHGELYHHGISSHTWKVP